MATTNGYAPVLAAVDTMQSNTDRAQKGQAHEFLDKFQKTPEAWNTTFAILQSDGATVQGKMFAATTLKGKVGTTLGSEDVGIILKRTDHI